MLSSNSSFPSPPGPAILVAVSLSIDISEVGKETDGSIECYVPRYNWFLCFQIPNFIPLAFTRVTNYNDPFRTRAEFLDFVFWKDVLAFGAKSS